MRTQIPVQSLKLGMYVDELDRPWEETPFLFQGFPIRTLQEIEQLKSCCSYVYVFQQESMAQHQPHYKKMPHRFQTAAINIQEPVTVANEKRRYEKQDHHKLVKELKEIKTTYDQSHHYILQTLNDVRFGRDINVSSAKSMARGIIQNENALVLLSLLKQHDEYTVRHSINVCILSLLLAKHLGLGESEMQTLGMGALLHDIGKMRLPIEILNKPEKLSAKEFTLVQRHPDVGYELLRNKKGLPPEALEIVRSHHERVDGSGYPRKLKSEEIGLFPRIVSIVDIYDAITTDRSYHDGISPHEAIRLIYEMEGDSFPPELMEHFIKCLSIFPIGSVVELDNGEIGIVMNVNRHKHLFPVVLLVLNRDKIPYYPRKVCNLELLSDRGNAVHIKRILESNAHGINTSNILFEEGDFSSLDLSHQLPAIEPEYH